MKQQQAESQSSDGLLVKLLKISALLLLAAGPAIAALTVAIGPAGGAGLALADVQAAGVCLMGAVFACLVLWSVAGMVSRQQQILRVLERQASAGPARGAIEEDTPSQLYEPRVGSPSRSAGSEDVTSQQLLAQLRELNTNVLLSDEQRQAKQRRQLDLAQRRLTAQIEQALAAGRFADADRSLAKLVELGGDDQALQPYQQKVDQARKAAEAEDVQRVTQRVGELLALAAFDPAERAVDELLATHPESVEASALLTRVQREAKAYSHTQRHELYAKVQACANQRQWRQALASAKSLLERFAQSAEAEAVQAELPTLRDNARIEEVRQLRDRIRDLIGRKQFASAADLAEEVIQRFPETAAAEELRGQLARLRERAAEDARNGGQA